MNIDKFLHAYCVTALWSSTDYETGLPLDADYSPDDIAPETLAQMREDCTDFIEANANDLAEYSERMENEEWSGEDRAGHDFWLTRNGHGAGFWDRGLGQLGERLSAAAKVYMGVYLYIGNDELIHAA